jgi:hypothetical protein
MRGERGSALVIAVLLMAILTLLGVSYLFMADTENRIAENERLSAQAFYFAEGVTREVKRWFDRPPYSASGGQNLSFPTTAVLDRTLRYIDTDGPGPADEGLADGSPGRPFYKLGVDRDGDGNDDIFDKPFRPDPADMFIGKVDKDHDGPDVRIDRGNAGSKAFLDALSEKVMPGFPNAAANIAARVIRIDVYAPPYLDTGGGHWVRYGVATISTRVQILRDPDGPAHQVMADRTITAVLNETPYGGAFGPFHSCDEIGWGNQFKVHWGPATAVTTGNMPVGAYNMMSRSVPRDIPATPKVDLLHGHLDSATWSSMKNGLNNLVVDDPWFSFYAGLTVQGWTASPQAFPPGINGQDDSNRFQEYPNVPCPSFNYDTWKSIAKSGESGVHYYAWASGTSFREGGSGNTEDFMTATDGKTGVFFFDTRDGLPPHDFDASNVAQNLTPDITISGTYGVRGLVYLNAKMWRVTGSPGRPARFTMPGEPFRDLDENGVRDPATEDYINLQYPVAALDDPIFVKDSDPGKIWNATGPTFNHDAVVWGILYVTGQFDASGTPYYDGSVITYAGTETGVKTVGTASLYWDPTIKTNWPPPDWNLPRVIITRWQTDE